MAKRPKRRFLANPLRRIKYTLYTAIIEMSCISSAFKIAAFFGLLGGVAELLDESMNEEFVEAILSADGLYKALTSLISLMVVFHTVQSHSRYMSGITLGYQMFSDFLDTASFLTSFVKASCADPAAKQQFLNTLARLFSLLFMSCLAELESDLETAQTTQKRKELRAHMFDLLDPAGLDAETLASMDKSENKVMVANQGILDLLMQGTRDKILDAPPPILSRAFQELGTGMTRFHEALKFKDTPFPEPYVILGDILLMVHSVMTPFAMTMWTDSIYAATFFSFTICFAFWSLHFIAEELENPFDNPDIDFDAKHLHELFNSRLLSLLSQSTTTIPGLAANAQNLTEGESMIVGYSASFQAIRRDLKIDAAENFEGVHDLLNLQNFPAGLRHPPVLTHKLAELGHYDVQAPPSCSTASTNHVEVSVAQTDDSEGSSVSVVDVSQQTQCLVETRYNSGSEEDTIPLPQPLAGIQHDRSTNCSQKICM